MITASNFTRQLNDSGEPASILPTHGARAWQRALAQAITDPLELCQLLGLDPQLALAGRAATASFRLRVPRGFVARMRHGDAADPLLRQVLPAAQELLERTGFGSDPLQEQAALRASGLLHKYAGRALLVTTGACAIHCRYCFRREFPYSSNDSTDLDGSMAPHGGGNAAPEAVGENLPAGGGRFGAALEAIARDSSIEEVILSGGDPLSLTTARLAQLTAALRQIRHVRRIRLHTRTPVVLPERIDDEFIDWLAGLPIPCVVVLHCNHANEIDASVRTAVARLRSTGVWVLNQSVLLAGVNDSTHALAALSEALWSANVLPYYLHLLDRVRGTGHFEVDEARARSLMAQLAARLPGYLVPRLTREVPGAPAKTILAPAPWPTA